MMIALFIVAGIFTAVLFALTVFFDAWVYLKTKDIDFVLSAWMNRNNAIDQNLLPKQAALLKAICLTERVLRYFFYFVLLPITGFFAFSLIQGMRS